MRVDKFFNLILLIKNPTEVSNFTEITSRPSIPNKKEKKNQRKLKNIFSVKTRKKNNASFP